MSDKGDLLEGTLALIKPDAVHKYREILKRIEEEGFLIVEIKSFNMSRAMARKFYQRAQHRKDSPPDFYRELLDYMTSGNIIAMCLARKDGVQKWREVMGPKKVSVARREAPNSIRARYGDVDNDMYNAVHGSDSADNAQREIDIIFPHILHGEAYREVKRTINSYVADNREYLEMHVCPTLLRGLSQLYDVRPSSPLSWLANWLSDNNPYKFDHTDSDSNF